jgi:hypothetical protein
MNRRTLAIAAPLATMLLTLLIFLGLHFMGAGKTDAPGSAPVGGAQRP